MDRATLSLYPQAIGNRIAGNFWGSKYSWFSNISQFVVFIFVVAACTAGKVVFNHENHEYFAPRRLPAIRYM